MKKYTILCLILFVSTLTFAQKSVLIRYQPKVGSTLKTDMTATMDMGIQAEGQDITTKIKMAFEMLYKTKARKKDVNDIEIVFDKIRMEMSNPMMSGSFDSENKDETDPFALKIAEGFKGVLDTPVATHVNTRGVLTAPIDVEKYFPQIPAAKAKELEEQMSNQFIHFPENKVKVGDTWTMATTMNQIGELELTYKLVAIEKRTLQLSLVGNMLKSDDMKMEMLATTIEGDVTLDRKTGETLLSTMLMEMDMKMEAQGSQMNMKMKAEIVLKTSQM